MHDPKYLTVIQGTNTSKWATHCAWIVRN